MLFILIFRIKKEKEEDFKKRVLGQKGLTKLQKEKIRKQNLEERDKFDLENLGNFKRAYPIIDNEVTNIILKITFFNQEKNK